MGGEGVKHARANEGGRTPPHRRPLEENRAATTRLDGVDFVALGLRERR
jgi:hypothetical protein